MAEATPVLGDPLTQLLITISLSGAIALVFRRAGINTIAGYILGGILGSMLGISGDPGSLLASLGLVILGFEIGAEVGGRAPLGSLRQAIVIEFISMSIVYISTGAISVILGLGYQGHLILFLIALNTSTGILYKVLSGRESEYVRSLLLSASVVEDTVALSGIAVISIISSGEGGALDIIISLGKLAMVSIAMLLAGVRVFRMLGRRLGDVEMLPIIALSAALAYWVAFGSIGVSQLLGAFIAGLALGRAVDLTKAINQLAGLRELGLLLYFSSLGGTLSGLGLGELSLLPTIFLLVFIVVIIKFAAFSSALWILGFGYRESVSTGLYLTSISELGIIIASHAYSSGLSGSYYILLSIYAVLFSAMVSSLATRFDERIVGLIELMIPKRIEITVGKYISRVRSLMASGVSNLSIFFYGFVSLVFLAVSMDAVVSYIKLLPGQLIPYGLISVVITSTMAVIIIPYIAWRLYRGREDFLLTSTRSIHSVIGINLSLLLAVFGASLETYIINKIIIEYSIEFGIIIRSHILFTIASIFVIVYMVKKIYDAIERALSERKPRSTE